ncbi:MAG: ABC transporter permease [Brumimicrobium sp.]|nr:ABC transporter permease [Brumimicrobium sp.]
MAKISLDYPINMQRFLPHRKPMLMVDFVTYITKEIIHTNFKIDADNVFIENGCFNETGVIENAAQTCSGIVGWPHFEKQNYDENYRVEGFISKIQKAEIFSLPPVGAIIETKGELVTMHPVENLYNCKMDCSTYCNGEKIAHCMFTLIIIP